MAAQQTVEAVPDAKQRNSSVSEEWSNDQYSLRVTSKEGFFCTIRLAAVLPLTPAETFELLARPDSHNIFRSITDNTYRKVLKWRDRHRGQVRVETEALAKWRFAMFSGKFATRLYVDLDRAAGTIDFRLAGRGGQMMRAFEGHWGVQGYEGRPPLDAIVAAPPSANLVSVARSIDGGGGQSGKDAAQHALQTLQSVTNNWFPQPAPQRTLITLEQSLQPGLVPPGPLGGLVKSISAAQVKGMLEDLQAEATRIRAGRPTPSSCCSPDDEFGFEGAGRSGRDGSGESSESQSPADAEGSDSNALTMDRWRSLPGSTVRLLTANASRARARRLRWLQDVGLDPS
jgi:hypothetical protein